MVGEQADVLEELEGHVQRALRQARGVEDLVLSWFWTLEELSHPGVHGEEAEEAEGYAGAGEEGRKGGDVGRACHCCGSDGARGWTPGEFGEERIEARLKWGGFGFEVGEEVEGVIEGREEGGQTTGTGEES